MERTDDAGRWESTDGGVSWSLAEPSQDWDKGGPDPEPTDPASAVLAAVQTARAEVAGYAASNGTRQAVEALATAVETLVQGDTP